MNLFEQEIKEFQEQIKKWQEAYPQWKEQIVFNEDLLKLKAEDIRYILVGDNPGKEEQKAHRYLIGTAGQGARRFFEETARLVDSFEKQVMVLNKTPVFTPSTLDLGELTEIQQLLTESQQYMALLMVRMQKILNCQLWITGFGGCRNAKGEWNLKIAKTRPLAPFFLALRESLASEKGNPEKLSFFKHFSYAHFQKDAHLGDIPKSVEEYQKKLSKIGSSYRQGFVTSLEGLFNK